MLTQKQTSRYACKGQYKVTLFPSGDFTIGRNQPIKADQDNHPLDGISQDGIGITYVSRQVEVKPDPQKLFDIAQQFETAGNDDLAYQFGRAAAAAADLAESDRVIGLSVASNSHKSQKRPRRGSTGITASGKRMVKSCALVLEEKYGKDCITFGTATLPTLQPDQLQTVCDNWSKLVKQFVQELRRLLKRRGLADDILYVTEIQEKRYERWGQVCPHLHWVMQGKLTRRSHWLITPDQVKQLWQNQLTNLLGNKINCDSATRIEKPRKSLSKEMGKYLSKGGKLWKKIKDAGHGHMLPTAYWGASKDLKAQVKKLIVCLTGDEALEFIDNLEAMSKAGLLKYHTIAIEYNGKEITVGWVGYIISQELQISLAA